MTRHDLHTVLDSMVHGFQQHVAAAIASDTTTPVLLDGTPARIKWDATARLLEDWDRLALDSSYDDLRHVFDAFVEEFTIQLQHEPTTPLRHWRLLGWADPIYWGVCLQRFSMYCELVSEDDAPSTVTAASAVEEVTSISQHIPGSQPYLQRLFGRLWHDGVTERVNTASLLRWSAACKQGPQWLQQLLAKVQLEVTTQIN